MDNLKKIKRSAQLASVLTKYGFEAIVTQTDIKKLIPSNFIESNEKRKEIFSLSVYERIRMVLEELGPAYVKLGQLLSNRDDLLPEELIHELLKLQDKVTTQDMDVHSILQDELMIDPKEFFISIDLKPIAAASLSQVYKGYLKEDNQKVIIKIKRTSIQDIIEADILIMKDVAEILDRYYDVARKIGLVRIVNAFEKSIIAELSFIQELSNIERFRKNFEGNTNLYVPKTYEELSNRNVLCMEFIDGIKISERTRLIDVGLNVEEVASKVVSLYLKQIIDFGFFHADPHSGNIFVLSGGEIAFVDFGSVGKMIPQDMQDIGSFVISILRKDMKKLVRIIKRVAIKYRISNELQLERDLYDFVDLMTYTSIKELELADITKRLGKLLNENEIILPDHIYLLVRGIILLEGIGRELNVDTNIIENIKPYGLKLIKKRLNPKYILDETLNKFYNWGDRMEELPEDTLKLLQKVNNGELEIKHNVKGLDDIVNSISLLAIAMIISSLAIGSAILILAGMPPKLFGVSVLGCIGFVFTGFASLLVLYRIFRRKPLD